MDKATITKSGKNWILKFGNKGPITIFWNNIPAEWDNAIVEVVKRDQSGQPIALKNGNVTLNKPIPHAPVKQSDNRRFNDNNKNRDRYNDHGNNDKQKNNPNNNTPNKSAKSPYNFVPLNDTVVYSDEQNVFFDKYDTNRNTGYINLEIENLTPIFIRGNKENFLLINGKPIIPGSSLRGLIRNMVEILSYSKIGFINDSRFFFRSFADSALRLRSEYNLEITKQTNVGILFQKKDRNYILVPSVLIRTIDDPNIVNDCIYNEETNIWKLYSGKMPGGQTAKRNNYEIKGRLINDKGATDIKWNDEIIKEYEDDINRKGLNVLEELKSKDPEKNKYKRFGIPIFYQTDESGKINSFGNTKNYRLPYHKTVRDHLFECHGKSEFWQNEKKEDIEKLDFSNLIFGKTDENNKDGVSVASRVYFYDAICDKPNLYDEKCLLKILASPKPTSFQLYLEQPNGVATTKKDIKHWNDEDTKIRGYKQYWHKNNGDEFKEKEGVTKSDSHSDYIKPIKSNNAFFGRIRFENLTDEELGVLLFALELPKGCCHKIGMGKPLGLGTIRITPLLVLDNRKDRYAKLLDDDGKWHKPQNEVKIDDLKKTFADFMLRKIGNGKTDLWEVERISQLKAMLEYDEKANASLDWLEETRYMGYTEFKKRDILDTPKNIKSKFKNDLP